MIDSSELVTDVYGYWPRFEGAYVLSASLETDSTLFYEYGERTLTLDLHWWLGAADHYPGAPLIFDEKDLHRRIRLAFCVENLRIHTFEVSNVSIDELRIQPGQGRLECKGGFELSCTFTMPECCRWNRATISGTESAPTGRDCLQVPAPFMGLRRAAVIGPAFTPGSRVRFN